MKHLSAALLACALLVTPAMASAATVAASSGDGRIIKSVNENDLADLVRAEGHTVDAMHPFESPSVRGKTEEGLLFVLVGTACSEEETPSCNGIMMQVRYDSDDTVTTDGVNQANLNEAAIAAWWDAADNTVGFHRYVVLDGGVTWANIRENLRVLFAVEGAASEYVFH